MASLTVWPPKCAGLNWSIHHCDGHSRNAIMRTAENEIADTHITSWFHHDTILPENLGPYWKIVWEAT